jgi:hypothetical protein
MGYMLIRERLSELQVCFCKLCGLLSEAYWISFTELGSVLLVLGCFYVGG